MATRKVEVALTGNIRNLEEALARAGLVAETSGTKIGEAFNKGTDRAAGGLSKLASIGASFGIPFTESLDRIGRKLDEAHTKTGKLSTALAEAGKVTLAAGTAGFAVAGVEATKLAQSFQTSTASIAANADISAKAADSIGKAFLGTAGKSIFSGNEMASAFAQVAGQLKLTEGHALSSAEAMKVMTAASDLAEGSHAGLAASTAALSTVMQAYHLNVDEAAGAADTLFNVSRAMNVPIDQVATGVNKLHGRLGELAPTLTDTSALMIELGQHGITGTRGVSVVNTALQTLVGGGTKTQEVLKALGVHIFDASGHFIGMRSVIDQLQSKLAGLTEQQRVLAEKTLFGSGAAQVMGQIVAEGAGKFDQATAAATKLNTAHKAAEQQSKTLHNQMEALKATVEDLGTKFGLFLIPKLEAVGHAISDVIGWFQKHKAAAEVLAGVITGVLGAAIGAFVGQKVAAFVGGIQSMASSVGALAAKFTGTAAVVEAEDAAIASSAETTAVTVDAAMGMSAGGIGAALGIAGVAVFELATHWKSAMGSIEDITRSVLNHVIDFFNATIGQITGQISNLQGSYGQPNLKGSNPGQQIGNFLEQRSGLSKIAIAGIMGNLHQESGFNAGLNDGTNFGIASWTGSRIADLRKFAQSTGKSPTDLFTQLGFLLDEMMPGHSHRAAYVALQSAKTPAQAAVAFEKLFEGAGVPMMSNRVNYANQAYAFLTGKGQASSPAEAAIASALTGGSGSGSSGNVNAALAALLGSQKQKTGAALGIPVAVTTMLSTAQALVGTQYTYGGGHSGWDPIEALKKIGVDCTGFVSQVLHSGGVLSTPHDTTTLPSELARGQGKYVTVYDRPLPGQQGHALIEILGRFFESGGNSKFNPRGGVAELTHAQAAGELALGGFEAFHPAGLNAPVKGGAKGSGNVDLTAQINGILAAQAAALQRYLQGLLTSGGNLLGSYQNAQQSGSAKALEKLLGATTAAGGKITLGGQADNSFNTLVAALNATHNKHLQSIADRLVAAHKAALADLKSELASDQMKKDAELLNLQATQVKDDATARQNALQAQLQIAKDQEQKVVDAMQAAAKRIDDTTSLLRDSFAQMVTAVTDATQQMADASQGIVTGIQDQTAIKVDILGERGLWGLNLIAQKQQVTLDVMKAGFDQQISAAQQNLDLVKTTSDATVAAKQIALDGVQLQADQMTANAQAAADTAQLVADVRKAAAQAALDAEQLHEDVSVVGPAQIAVDLNATAPKAVQDAFAAQLAKAQGGAAGRMALAQGVFNGQTFEAGQYAQRASGQLAITQGQAALAIAQATQALTTAQGNAQLLIAQAQQALTSIEGSAAQTEAAQQGQIDITKATASTQYAGGGIVVNNYFDGFNTTDANGIASEVGWALRPLIPA